jgi:LacI family transcriptional regulator
MVTIRDVAKAARVSTATVSAVINGSAFVSPELRHRVENAVAALRYAPSLAARNLKSGRSHLIALVVADLANPFFARIVWAAEAAAAAWGYSLVVFNSDEKPDTEKRNIARIRALRCDGAVLSPVGQTDPSRFRELEGSIPTVLLGGASQSKTLDTVTLNNRSAGRQVTEYLLDLQHTRIGSVTGPLHLDQGRGRYEGMLDAMTARGLAPDPDHVRSGEFREDAAYSVAHDLLRRPDRPTALYAANGLMALGVMRAVIDLGLTCPDDISIVSTDLIAGIAGIQPRLTRTEHPIVEMTNEAMRMLIGRVDEKGAVPARNVVFQPNLVIGDSVAVPKAIRRLIP